MYLARPSFRPWRSLFALVLAYFLAGFLYLVPDEVLHPLMLFVVPILPLLNLIYGIYTVLYFGFPPIPPVDGDPTNLYPIIVPLALVLLAFATRAVRFGRKPPAGIGPAQAPPAGEGEIPIAGDRNSS